MEGIRWGERALQSWGEGVGLSGEGAVDMKRGYWGTGGTRDVQTPELADELDVGDERNESCLQSFCFERWIDGLVLLPWGRPRGRCDQELCELSKMHSRRPSSALRLSGWAWESSANGH